MFIYIQQHSTSRRIYVSSGRLVARPGILTNGEQEAERRMEGA